MRKKAVMENNEDSPEEVTSIDSGIMKNLKSQAILGRAKTLLGLLGDVLRQQVQAASQSNREEKPVLPKSLSAFDDANFKEHFVVALHK